MKYVSTRGGITPVNFTDAVMMGLATDGGLLLPETIPCFNKNDIERFQDLTYQELAMTIFHPFVGNDIPLNELKNLIKQSYSSFNHPAVAPLVKQEDLYILELFHGQTLAFKDIALQFLGNLFAWILAERQESLNILGATSGDTGSAAIYGVRGKDHINIFIIHPHGKVSHIQERQMTSVLDHNVFNIAVEGIFDDGQRIVKEIFSDLDFKHEFHLGAVNSINWARIMAQIVYYFSAYLQLPDSERKTVDIVVPSGNFGNIFAGYLAKRMGLPIRRLVLASNENNILNRFISTGVYQGSEVVPTWSPSMDIQVASNFERYWYYLHHGDPEAAMKSFAQLRETGAISISREQLLQVQKDFATGFATNDETLTTIADFYQQTGYILDPHTAVGVKVAQQLRLEEGINKSTSICLATAHPAKFPDAVHQAIGIYPPVPESLRDIDQRECRYEILPADTATVKDYIRSKLQTPS
ncbi:MAG TPA: threonine synthase [Proteobacteria bacterium]|nr:threonine synthase [Pseudomonadota bacterium]